MASSSFSFPACARRESVRFMSCSTLERGGKKHTLLTDTGRKEGFLAHGGVSRLCATVFFTFCGRCRFGSRTDKTDNKTLTRAHSSSVQGHHKASISLLTGVQGLGFHLLQKRVSGALAHLPSDWSITFSNPPEKPLPAPLTRARL